MFRYNLFLRPNLLSGMSRVVDIGYTLHQYNHSDYPEATDS